MPWRFRLVVTLTAAGIAVAGTAVAGCAAVGAPHSGGSQAGASQAGRPAAAAAQSALLAARQPHLAAPVQSALAATPANAKKGVGAWAFDGVRAALAKSGASWYYTWGVDHPGVTSPRGVQFVPMIWGAGSVTAANLREVKREGHYLLGFNEPDNPGQSNMTVSQALALWPQLMATKMTLGSPAVASGAATPGGWLDQFMAGAKARGYRVNFITLHWYGGDFATGPAVQQLKAYVQATHARYHLPIWLTEFALIRFGATTTFPSARLQAAFLTAATSMLQKLAYVQRYAWFALPATSGDGTAGLFRSGAVATPAGLAFEKVDS
jgi:hypothetical protein